MSARGRRRIRRNGGFTLIELVVVLGVLAVAAVFALPAISRGTDAVRLRADSGRVAALLRDARQHAVSQRRPTRVSLDRARGAVVLAWEDADQPLREIELSAGHRLSIESGKETLAFSPRGITQEARWVVEGVAGRRLVIDIHGVSGRVTVTAAPTR